MRMIRPRRFTSRGLPWMMVLSTSCARNDAVAMHDSPALTDSGEDSAIDSGVPNQTQYLTDVDASFVLADVVPTGPIANLDTDGTADLVLLGDLAQSRDDRPAELSGALVLLAGPVTSVRDASTEHLITGTGVGAPWAQTAATGAPDGTCCDLLVATLLEESLILRFHLPFAAGTPNEAVASLLFDSDTSAYPLPAAAGDMNDDGVGDVIVGSSGGAAGTPMWAINGATWHGARMADDVALAQIRGVTDGAFIDLGDTNGDGADDFGIGQPDDGFALLFLGPLSGSLTADDAETRVTTHPPESGYRCCTPQAGADIDGDGHSDLLLADPSLDPTNPEEYEDEALGLLAVFAGPLAAGALDLTEGATTTFQCADRLLLGEDALLADVTGDGAPDVVARTMIYGAQSAILAWSEAEPGRMDESSARAVITPEHPDASTNFAERMAGGDVDDDGVDDLLISRGVSTDDSYQMDTLVFLGPI